MAFVGYDDDGLAVYTVRSDGSDLTRISETLSGPAWSPRGRRVALVVPDGDGAALYTFAYDGSDPVRVTGIVEEVREVFSWGVSESFWVSSVSWSPDGSEILVGPYVVNLESPETLSLLQFEEGGLGRVAYLHGLRTSWSPDGSAIAAIDADGLAFQELWEGLLFIVDRAEADFIEVPAAESGQKGVVARKASCSGGYVVADPASNPGLVSDCETLMDIRDSLAGEAYLNWDSDIPIEKWGLVGLGGSPPRVTLLYSDGYISGSIPPELGDLTHLEELILIESRLTGSIPAELGKLSNLRVLNLGGNQLTGSIPSELSKLANLETLILGANQLTGSIPPELGNLPNLSDLNVWKNELEGCITLANGREVCG